MTIASVVARATEAKTEVVEMPKIVKHAHNGKTLTLKEWAKEPEAKGLSLTTLRDRVNTRRMTIAQALEETPRPRPHATPSKSAKATAKSATTPAKVATLDEHIAKRARIPARIHRVDAHITEIGSAEHAASVLKRLGYVVEDAGIVPAGRLILVRTPHAPQVSL